MVLHQWFKQMTLHCFSSDSSKTEDKYDHYFPDDIWIEILTRVPADRLVVFKRVCIHWRLLISSYDFFKLHLKRAKIEDYIQHSLVRNSVFSLGDGRLEKNLPFFLENWKRFHGIRRADLIGSCDGLLLFQIEPGPRSLIFNHVTQESRIIPSANDNGNTRCIFFDRFEDDYKLLHLSPRRTDTIPHDFIYNFNRGVWTRLKSVETHHLFQPRLEDPPVVVSDALHWTGYCYFGCSMMVLVFKIESKDFLFLPYPTAVNTELYSETNCCLSSRQDDPPHCHSNNESIKLIAKDGNLCLGHTIRHRKVIEIWFLQNYGDWGSWTRMFMVDLYSFLISTPPTPCFHKELVNSTKIVSFNGDDILIAWPQSGLYLYNLETKKINVIEDPKLSKTIMTGGPYNCISVTKTLLSPNNVYTTP